ncbi:MAG: macro domain-containing protein [Nannocystaceae bacterium]
MHANGRLTSEDIHISTQPWEQVEVDAFVCPINSEGTMTEYPASKLQDLVGLPLEPFLKGHTPLAIGAALVTQAGRMRARCLIHVPNTATSGGRVQVEEVLRATSAALVACTVRQIRSVAVPLMGAFDTGILAEEAARAILSQYRAHRGEFPSTVYLMASNADEYDVFETAYENTT